MTIIFYNACEVSVFAERPLFFYVRRFSGHCPPRAQRRFRNRVPDVRERAACNGSSLSALTYRITVSTQKPPARENGRAGVSQPWCIEGASGRGDIDPPWGHQSVI